MSKSSAKFSALGFIAGVAFIVACPDGTSLPGAGTGGGSTGRGDSTSDWAGSTGWVGTASAGGGVPSDCATWELRTDALDFTGTVSLPAGWDPFAATDGHAVSRRCLD